LYSTIRGYVRDGRLRENWAARLLPRADTPSVALCVWCATNYLVERFGEEVRSTLWGNRLKGRRNLGLAKMYAARLCSWLTTDGGSCPQRARRGSRYCFVHDFPTHYANQIRQHGKPCRAKNSKGEPCRNRAMQEFGVCWYHGGKAARTSMRLAAFPESPAAAAARKHKQRTHHARKAVFLESGRRPTESFERTEHRCAREERIIRRHIGSSLYDDFRPQRARPLKPLYPT